MNIHKLSHILAATVSISCVSASTWNSTTTGGQWNNSANWTGGIPNGTGATADFTLTADYTVNLVGGPFTVGNLGVSSDTSALVINPGTLNFAIAAGMPTITFNTTRTTQPTMLTIYANLSGNQGLMITGNNRVGVYFRGDGGATSTLTGGIDISSAGNFVNFTTTGILNGNKVTFNAANNTLALGLAGSSTSNTWSSEMDIKTYNSSINSRSTGVQTLSGIISGSTGNLTFTGANQTTAAEFRLQANNTYTGNTQIASGLNHVIVTAEHANALGQGTGAAVTFGNGNSSLRLSGGITVSGKNLTLRGAGNNGEGSLQSSSGTNVWNGTVAVGSDANPTVGVSAGSRLALNGVVSGNQGLIKKGAGTLLLGNTANTYTGATVVEGGTLLVNGSIVAGSGLTVKTGATLGGNGGTIAGNVLVESGGTFDAGENGIGTLNILSGDLTLVTNAVFAGTINSSTLTNNSVAISGNLNLSPTNGTVFTLQDIGGAAPMAYGTRFSLLSYTGTWNEGLLRYEGNALANLSTFAFGGHDFRIYYDSVIDSEHEVALQVIPEPSSIMLILVSGVILMSGLSRRNSWKRSV